MSSIELSQQTGSRIYSALRRFVGQIRRIRVLGLLRWAVVPLMLLHMLAKCQCASVDNNYARQSTAAMISLPVAKELSANESQLVQRAQENPIGLLTQGLKWLKDNDIQDYQGQFTVQERINGQLKKSVVWQFKFRAKPFALALRVIEGTGRFDRLLCLEGEKMVVHPSGLAGQLVAAVYLDPEDRRVRESSLRPVNEFGLKNALERIISTYQTSVVKISNQDQGPEFSSLNGSKVVTIYLRDDRTKAVVDLDAERLIPFRIRQYTHDGQLLCSYQYDNLTFNCLDDYAFAWTTGESSMLSQDGAIDQNGPALGVMASKPFIKGDKR